MSKHIRGHYYNTLLSFFIIVIGLFALHSYIDVGTVAGSATTMSSFVFVSVLMMGCMIFHEKERLQHE